ncbi:YceD family protein [Reinekea sp. G2M2-21]|uniref:YceD family protein n=1 Tax=Reinekea sp. G2M2-21 TaxID=2788942 RepID=UPI0018AA0C15|nr:YceD family protein [Reinekea sp. G2M2-21]
MSNFELPDRVNPYQLADKKSELSGEINAQRLKRLDDVTEGVTESAQTTLSFDLDDSGRRVITGHVQGAADVLCQRCLKAFNYKLEGSFNLALVYYDEMAKALPAHLDSLLLLPDEPLDVASIVEDELLLCLPMHAMHPEGECHIETHFGADESGEVPERANPFDVLKDLK